MKRFVVVLGLPLLLAACVAKDSRNTSWQPKPIRYSSDSPQHGVVLSDVLPEGCREGESVEVNGARIVAIVADQATTETPYLVLHEAMEAETCAIRETGAVDAQGGRIDGDVNTLLVTNSGNRPIFLMAGDLVLGGKQDRILAESVIVEPGTTDMPIPVFCVEHGRWTVQAKDGAHADSGTFYNESRRGHADIRVKSGALIQQSQQQVWANVAWNNAAFTLTTNSGTLRATFDDSDTVARIDEAYARAAKVVEGKVVGFAVIHENELVAMDIFDSTALTAKLSEKLLRSYVITALSNGFELPLPRKLVRRTVTLQCENEDVRKAAEALGTALQVQIAVDQEIIGNVTLELEQVDGVTAISTLAERVNATAVVNGNRIDLYALHQPDQTKAVEGVSSDGIDFQSIQINSPNFRSVSLEELAFPPPPPTPPAEGQDEATPPAETPNDRTVNTREYGKEDLRYSCEDKKTRRKVQVSYLRR